MLGALGWPFAVYHGALLPVVVPAVALAVQPAVQTGLVLPLVVLAAKGQCILVPYQGLAQGESCRLESAAEVQSLVIGMPYIEAAALLGELLNVGVITVFNDRSRGLLTLMSRTIA